MSPLYNPPAAGGGSTPIRGDWKPQHASRKAENIDATVVHINPTATLAAAGFLHMVKCWVEDTSALTNLHFYVNSAGVTLTSGQCKGFIYSSAGTLIAQTADLATVLTSTGFKTLALTAESGQSLALGGPSVWVHLGLLVNGTTMPGIMGIPNSTGSASEWGLTNATMWRFLRTSTAGNTSVPASRSADLVEDLGRLWWMGLS